MVQYELVILITGIAACISSFFAALFAFLSYRRKIKFVPDFFISFPGDEKERLIRKNQLEEILIHIKNIGNEMAENIEVHLFFPPEFEISIKNQPDFEEDEEWLTIEMSDSEYPNHWNVICYLEDLGPDYYDEIKIFTKTPNVSKKYKIFVEILCKGIGRPKSHPLLLNVF